MKIGYFLKSFNKTAKQIMRFSSQTFGRSPHFIKFIVSVYYFIFFSCSVIYFIARILLVRIPKYPDHRPRRRYPGKKYRRGYQHNFKKETTSKEEKDKELEVAYIIVVSFYFRT